MKLVVTMERDETGMIVVAGRDLGCVDALPAAERTLAVQGAAHTPWP